MSGRKILVAGIGNVFMGDDAFGVRVIERMRTRPPSEDMVLMDAGIRGLDLTYALMGSDYAAAILVDVTARGGRPGTLYVLDPAGEAQPIAADVTLLDTHSMHPARILDFLRACALPTPALRVVACEPESLGSPDEPQLGLSPAVAEAVERAVALVDEVYRNLRNEVLHA